MPSRRESIEAMLVKTPDDPFLRYGWAMELLKEGNVAGGLAGLEDVARRHPDYDAAYFQLGQVYAQQGETDAAREWLQRGIAVATRRGNSHAAGEMQGLLDML